MATLADILKDKANYADNIVWDMGNGTRVTLGQLRELSGAEAKRLSDAEAKLNADRAALDASMKAGDKSRLDAANLYVTVQSAVEAMKHGKWDDPSIKVVFGDNPAAIPALPGNNRPADPFADLARYESDALIGPVVKAIRFQEQQHREALKVIDDLKGVNTRMATAYINGSLSDRYDRLIPEDQQDKFPLKTLIETAVNNQWTAVDGTPDIKRAYRAAKSPEDAAAKEAKIREDERKKVLAEMNGNGDAVLHLPRPDSGHFGLDVHNRSGAAPKAFSSLDEAFAAAAKDSSIWTDGAQA